MFDLQSARHTLAKLPQSLSLRRWIGHTCVHESTNYFPVARILSCSRQQNIKQTIQIIAKQYWNVDNCGVHAKKITMRRTKSCQVWRQTAINIYTYAFQRGCSCFISHDYFIVSTCPFWSAFTFDLFFSPTHTWWHMDAIFSQNSHAAQQLRNFMAGRFSAAKANPSKTTGTTVATMLAEYCCSEWATWILSL